MCALVEVVKGIKEQTKPVFYFKHFQEQTKQQNKVVEHQVS